MKKYSSVSDGKDLAKKFGDSLLVYTEAMIFSPLK